MDIFPLKHTHCVDKLLPDMFRFIMELLSGVVSRGGFSTFLDKLRIPCENMTDDDSVVNRNMSGSK